MGLDWNDKFFEAVYESHQFFLIIINQIIVIYFYRWTWTHVLGSMKYWKSVAVWKICKRSFICHIAGRSCFIRLEMAQEWIKTLPCSILQFNWIQKVLKRSSSLWRALTFKRIDLQIWDWSRMKENLKILKIIFDKKVKKSFF